MQSERPSDGIDDLDSPGADPNISNRDGATALHFAADKGYIEIIQELLSAGAKQKADKKNVFPAALAEVMNVGAVLCLTLLLQIFSWQTSECAMLT